MPSLRDYLRRYWFEFDVADRSFPSAAGVTAVDRQDAEELLSARVFGSRGLPSIRRVVEDVDVRDLDQAHVVPNMADPSVRGVWWPRSPRPTGVD